jgi:exodeoxyribonuclease III
VCVITKATQWVYGDEIGPCGFGPTSDKVTVHKGFLTDMMQCIVHADGGRVMTLEFKDFNLICTVVPSSGEKLDKLDYRTGEWDGTLSESLRELDTGKPTIVIGDLKIAPEGEKDVYNWTTAPRLKDAEEPKMCENDKKKGGVPGMTRKERESFQEMLETNDGFVDSFRHFHPDATGWYTRWSVRAGNRPYNAGVRSDLALVPTRTLEDDADVKVVDAFILDKTTAGHSDHAPIGITLKIGDA